MNYYLLVDKDIYNNVNALQIFDYDRKIKYYGDKLIKDVNLDYSDHSEENIANMINSFDYLIKINNEDFINELLNTKFKFIYKRNIKEVFIKLNLEEYLI